MTHRDTKRRQKQIGLGPVVICIAAVCLLLVILFSGGNHADPSLSSDPTTNPATTPTTHPATVPTTVPPTTQVPTEPPLTYPPDATPQQKLEAFMEYYDLSLEDYPLVVQEAFETSKENIDFLLNFPFLHENQHEIDISGYDISEGVPLFIQWDERWGYLRYAGNYAGLSACGPTCLSMVAYYLTGDAKYTPAWMIEYAETNGYCVNRGGTLWSFFTEGAVKMGFVVKQLYLTERKMISTLEEGKLIIMSVGPGHFTSAGHFIVVTGYEDGYFTVNDPNSYANSQRKWAYDEFADQVKNLWSFGL